MQIIKHAFELHKIPLTFIKNALWNCWLGLIIPERAVWTVLGVSNYEMKPGVDILHGYLTTKVTCLREQRPKYPKVTIISNHDL